MCNKLVRIYCLCVKTQEAYRRSLSDFTLLSTSMILEPANNCMTSPEVTMGEIPSSIHVPLQNLFSQLYLSLAWRKILTASYLQCNEGKQSKFIQSTFHRVYQQKWKAFPTKKNEVRSQLNQSSLLIKGSCKRSILDLGFQNLAIEEFPVIKQYHATEFQWGEVVSHFCGHLLGAISLPFSLPIIPHWRIS